MNTYLVNEPDQDKEWTPQAGFDEEDAAERYAEKVDCDSGGEFQGGTVILVKTSDPDAVSKHFLVKVDFVKTYAAFERPRP